MKGSLKITLIYLACGLLWILLSDRFLQNVFNYDSEVSVFQTYKGVFFVGFTALLLFFLVNWFYKQLAAKVAKLEETNAALEESEKRYIDLFRLSPLPMWVFEVESLKFLAVNDAAVNQYGYTREEFLSMTVKDIRNEEEVPLLMESIADRKGPQQFVFKGVFRHKKKSGEEVTVEIRSNEIKYKGADAKLILVNDITERMNYIAAIEAQNAKLQDIAYLQSHVVRAPLATMMGFVNLLEEAKGDDADKEEMLKNILVSANELDVVIRQISDKTQVGGKI